MLNEQENGKTAVTRILSGVDDITINGSNKNRLCKKEEMELVSIEIILLLRCSDYRSQRTEKKRNPNIVSYSCFFFLYYSIMMKRKETASHRVINYEP